MILSNLCSLMEAAILSITPSQLAELRQRSPKAGQICQSLKRDIDKPIAVILIINTAAHTIGAAVAGGSLAATFGSQYMGVFSLVFTLLMVQYTEILPKTIGVRFNAFVMAHTARILKFAIVLMTPVIWLVHFINRPFEGKEQPEHAGNEMEEELDALASMARQAKHITPTQEQAIQEIPDLKEDRICELMVPRAEMVCLRESMSRDEVLETARRSPHSRYPVVSGRNPESFSGVLEIRQLLFNDGDWRGLLRPAPVVSGDEFQLLLAENIEKLDSRLLLVKGKSSEIIGMITTNDLLMKLFQKAEPDTAA